MKYLLLITLFWSCNIEAQDITELPEIYSQPVGNSNQSVRVWHESNRIEDFPDILQWTLDSINGSKLIIRSLSAPVTRKNGVLIRPDREMRRLLVCRDVWIFTYMQYST